MFDTGAGKAVAWTLQSLDFSLQYSKVFQNAASQWQYGGVDDIVNKNIEVYVNIYYFYILCQVLLINREQLGLFVS